MPMVDRVCDACGTTVVDKFVHTYAEAIAPVPCTCGGQLERTLLPGRGMGANVITDDIPGGLYMTNGICHDDGTPKRYDSKSAIRAELRARGMTWGVDGPHVGKRGSDKHPDTTKWR